MNENFINTLNNQENYLNDLIKSIDILYNDIEILEKNEKAIVVYRDFNYELFLMYAPYIYFIVNYFCMVQYYYIIFNIVIYLL